MCDPVTIIAVGGAVVGAVGARNEAQQQKYDMEGQADMAAYRADIEREKGEEEMRLGKEQLQDKMMADGQMKSKAALNLAGRGLSLDSGSTSLDALDDLDFIHGIENTRMSKNTGKRAQGFKNQGAMFDRESEMYNDKADSISPNMAMVTSLLGSSGNVASAPWGA